MSRPEMLPSRDEVLDEVFKNKEELARRHDYDVAKIVADVQEREKHSGRRLLTAPVRQSFPPRGDLVEHELQQ